MGPIMRLTSAPTPHYDAEVGFFASWIHQLHLVGETEQCGHKEYEEETEVGQCLDDGEPRANTRDPGWFSCTGCLSSPLLGPGGIFVGKFLGCFCCRFYWCRTDGGGFGFMAPPLAFRMVGLGVHRLDRSSYNHPN